MRSSLLTLFVLGSLGVLGGVVFGLRTCLVSTPGCSSKPTASQAIGKIKHLPPKQRRAFTVTGQFAPKTKPRPGEWLAEHHEPGQTYDAFVKARYNRPTTKRRTLVLQPVGTFPPERSPPVDALKQYAQAFFQLPVSVRSTVDPRDHQFARRINTGSKKPQILTGDVLRLLKLRLLGTTYAALAVTMIDLYPSASWNFVFGQAMLRGRVGVFSFARYDPAFYGGASARTKGWQQLLLRRSSRVLNHETGHMFGLHHCIYYQCAMNGSNHLGESDRNPLHLCPICLRKLHHAIGFDIEKRYAALQRYYAKHGLTKAARWVAKRLTYIRGGK